MTRAWLLGWGIGVATLGAVFAVTAVELRRDSSVNNVAPSGEASVSLSSGHFKYTYPPSSEEMVTSLVEMSERVDRDVRSVLLADQVGEIAIEVSESPLSHGRAGAAQGRTVWLSLELSNEEDLERTLAHELAHVYVHELTAGALSGDSRGARFIQEGVASYVEACLYPSDAHENNRLTTIALAHDRRALRFGTMIDDRAFRAERDPALIYHTAPLFFGMLVASEGPAGLRRVLREFGRTAVPGDGGVRARFERAYRAAGFDLQSHVDRYHAQLDRLLDTARPLIDRVPRVSSTVSVGDNGCLEIKIQSPEYAAWPDGWVLECHARGSPEDDAHQFAAPTRRVRNTLEFARRPFASGAFQYQIGWRHSVTGVSVFEPWSEELRCR